MPATISVYGEGQVVSLSGSGANFIPLTQWIEASDVLQARSTLEMRGLSNSCQINGAYQTSNDKISLDTPASILATPSYMTAEGFQYPTAGFTDLSAATKGKRFIRFGAQCQGPGSGVAACWAAILVEILTQYPNLVSSAGRILAAGAVTNYVAVEATNGVASSYIGSALNFAKDYPSNPSSFTVANQIVNNVGTTAFTYNIQVGGCGIYHATTAAGTQYFYETVTTS